MQSWNCCLLSSALEMDGGNQPPWKHSSNCSSETMAVLVVGRGLWRPSYPAGFPAAARPGPPAVRFGMSPRNLLSFHISGCGYCTNRELALPLVGELCFFLHDLHDFLSCSLWCQNSFCSAAGLQPHSLRRQKDMCCVHSIA